MPAIDRLFLEICKLYCQTKDSVKSRRNRENTALNLHSEPKAQVSEWCFQLYITLRYVPCNSEVTWSKLTLFRLIQSVSSYVIFLIFFHGWYLSCQKKKKDLQGHVDALSPMALHLPVYLLLPSQKVLRAAPLPAPIFTQVASASPLPATFPLSVTIASSRLPLPPERRSSNTKWWHDSWSMPTSGSLLTPSNITTLVLDDVTHSRWSAKAFLVAPE